MIQIRVSVKNQNRLANSVDLDETAPTTDKLYPFIPKFQKWILPLLNLVRTMFQIRVKNQNRLATSVDLDKTAHYEPSHQVLHCFKKIIIFFWSCRAERVKELWRDAFQNDIPFHKNLSLDYIFVSFTILRFLTISIRGTILADFLQRLTKVIIFPHLYNQYQVPYRLIKQH